MLFHSGFRYSCSNITKTSFHLNANSYPLMHFVFPRHQSFRNWSCEDTSLTGSAGNKNQVDHLPSFFTSTTRECRCTLQPGGKVDSLKTCTI